MFVDLLRNDIGKVSRVGSVRVPKLFHLERHASVWRLVSIVCGELRPGLDAVDLLRACLPGGSVTGCPKTRAMEIIEELEPVRRGVPARRDLLPEPESKPSLMFHAQPFAGYPAELYAPGMRAITSCIPRNERSPPTKVKALSYLDSVLAHREAGARGVDEALLSNTAGNLVCASAANLFLVLDDAWAHRTSHREPVTTELAPHVGVDVVKRVVRPEELHAASEGFLTNALLGIMPLTEVDGHPIGTSAPGSVSLGRGAELEKLWARHLDR